MGRSRMLNSLCSMTNPSRGRIEVRLVRTSPKRARFKTTGWRCGGHVFCAIWHRNGAGRSLLLYYAIADGRPRGQAQQGGLATRIWSLCSWCFRRAIMHDKENSGMQVRTGWPTGDFCWHSPSSRSELCCELGFGGGAVGALHERLLID